MKTKSVCVCVTKFERKFEKANCSLEGDDDFPFVPPELDLGIKYVKQKRAQIQVGFEVLLKKCSIRNEG